MQIKKFSMALLLVLATSLVAMPLEAQAARMGGGRSMGSKPSMSMPIQRPSTSSQGAYATQRGATASGNTMAMPRSSGLGGMLGGFLLGGMLGSFLGGGHNAATTGTAEGDAAAAASQGPGIGLMDIVLIGLVIWLVMRFVRRRKAQNTQYDDSRSAFQGGNEGYGMQRNSTGGSAWDMLRQNSSLGRPDMGRRDIPAGFDVAEFIEGAKMAYTRMQSAWDRRDLDDIANFATPAIVDALREQLAEDPEPGQTQIFKVNAQLLQVTEFGALDRAQVLFDVLMIENPDQVSPVRVREVWVFVREHETGNWMLDAIQQTE